MKRSATFSPCRTWRYLLTREWDDNLPALNVVGLNPSTADETIDDPTIRRCIRFAHEWGYGRLLMTNIFAFRATDPRALRTEQNPIGPDNDAFLVNTARRSKTVAIAWGNHGALYGRDLAALALLRSARTGIWCFGLTKTQQPKHPLYLPASTQLQALGDVQ